VGVLGGQPLDERAVFPGPRRVADLERARGDALVDGPTLHHHVAAVEEAVVGDAGMPSMAVPKTWLPPASG